VFVIGDVPVAEADPCHRYDLENAATFLLPPAREGGDQVEVNVIRLRHDFSFAEVLGRMDIGLCQLGLDADGHLWATEECQRDVAKRTITVLFPPESDRDYDHLRRVQVKYPDHEVVWTTYAPVAS